jgi:hypothetical protein
MNQTASRYAVTLTFEVEVEASSAERACRYGKLKVRRGGKSQVVRAVAVRVPFE